MNTIKKSYRVSKNFEDKLQLIQEYMRDNLGIHYSQAELLDEMVDLYYLRITAKSNILSELFKEESRNNLQLFQNENAKMYNHIMKNLIKRIDQLENELVE